MLPIDKYGFPVELIEGRPITNCVRVLLHADVLKSLRYSATPRGTGNICGQGRLPEGVGVQRPTWRDQ